LSNSLRDPQENSRSLVGRIPPRGVLLVGRSGTGKTLTARAVAGESQRALLHDFGLGLRRKCSLASAQSRGARHGFEAGERRNAPCIIFIDEEIDAVGRHRGRGPRRRQREREQTLNQFAGRDGTGFEQNEGIIIIAATNRPTCLTPALLRAWPLFDRQIVISNPDFIGRGEDPAGFNVRKVPLGPDVDLKGRRARNARFSLARI